MKGMEMMLKSMLGVDPEELKAQMEAKIAEFQSVILAFKTQLDRVEANQQMLYRLMVEAELIHPIKDDTAGALEHVNVN